MRSSAAVLCFVLCWSTLFLLSQTAIEPAVAIKIDQLGYRTEAPKVAFVVTGRPAATFTVRKTSGEEAFRGKLNLPATDADTGDSVQAADFSSLQTPGTYFLDIPNVGRSWKFEIADDVFARAYDLAMRSFYGQRCGTNVDMGKEFPSFTHPKCHLRGEFHPSSGNKGARNNIGGWHDAGDYGRYTVNSAITNATLLWAYEIFGPALKDRKLNIPETGNGTPDILNETRWNIEWMLQMQDEDGGAWHKQTSARFPAMIAPQDDDLVSEVIGTGAAPFKSTCATADLAAVAAIAARVYAPFDKAFAERNLAVAVKAWKWAEQNPNVVFKNPEGVSTGEYGDKQCGDERLWAAAELWRTTGDETYNNYFIAHYAEYLSTVQSAAPESWNQLAPMALWTYALGNRKESDSSAVSTIKKASIDATHEIATRTKNSPYRNSLKSKDYVWGSNGVAANYGMQLLIANIFSPNAEFKNAAADNLHYLLGRNTFSLSWVTQLGENPFKHPHHRPSVAMGDKDPWPGLLSGGPNANRQDEPTKALPNLPPAKIYVDNKNSYASNEIAINWQAALVFLLARQLKQ